MVPAIERSAGDAPTSPESRMRMVIRTIGSNATILPGRRTVAMKRKTTRSDPAGLLVPRQQRSRDSLERILRATERLLMRTNGAEFTLADISRESKVSIGGIYRRFRGRDALLLAVQARLAERMSDEYGAVEAQAFREGRTLRKLVDIQVAGLAEMLRRNGPLIKAIMEASWTAPEVGKGGFRAFEAHAKRFRAQVLLHAEAIRHPEPELAADLCFVCIFELVASHWGFGRRTPSEQKPWPVLVQELQRLCFAYLTGGARPR